MLLKRVEAMVALAEVIEDVDKNTVKIGGIGWKWTKVRVKRACGLSELSIDLVLSNWQIYNPRLVTRAIWWNGCQNQIAG